jgi:hypothetical protein
VKYPRNTLAEEEAAVVSIVVDWQATMMANSARDPLWRAKVASEVKRNPALQQEIETICGRCHVPMANVEAEFAGVSATLFGDDGFSGNFSIGFDFGIARQQSDILRV